MFLVCILSRCLVLAICADVSSAADQLANGVKPRVLSFLLVPTSSSVVLLLSLDRQDNDITCSRSLVPSVWSP